MNQGSERNITLSMIDKFQSLFDNKYRYKVYYGGRGGGKSWNIAIYLLLRSVKEPVKILCAREIQKTIEDSVYSLLVDLIRKLGIEESFIITNNRIRNIIGSRFIFRGVAHDPLQLKGLEDVDVCWLSEAQNVSKESLNFLFPTIRKKNSQIIIDFNPQLETDPIYRRFITKKKEYSIVTKINYLDNPFVQKELVQEAKESKKENYEEYCNIWLGSTIRNTESQIFKDKFSIKNFKVHNNVVFYYGLDWGFSIDPLAIIRCYIHENNLYVDQEAGGTNIELDLVHKYIDSIKGAKNNFIFADCSRPESIAFVRRQFYKIKAASKWNGSVEDGIEYIKSFDKVIIHERCRETIKNFMLYCYKTDRVSGNILPIIKKANDHYIDAIRYALTPIIKKEKEKKIKSIVIPNFMKRG